MLLEAKGTFSSFLVWAASAEYYILGMVNNKYLVLTVSSLGNPRPKCQHIQCLMRPASWFIETFFSMCPHLRWKGQNEFSTLLFIRALIIFMKTPPSWLNFLLKASPLGLRSNMWTFQGYKHSGSGCDCICSPFLSLITYFCTC